MTDVTEEVDETREESQTETLVLIEDYLDRLKLIETELAAYH